MGTMYKTISFRKNKIIHNTSVEGETLEQKVERIIENKEPIQEGAPLIFTERKDGVLPGFNVKTDRWDVAIDAMDKVSKSIQAKREAKAEMSIVKDENKAQEGNGGAESTQGTK